MRRCKASKTEVLKSQSHDMRVALEGRELKGERYVCKVPYGCGGTKFPSVVVASESTARNGSRPRER